MKRSRLIDRLNQSMKEILHSNTFFNHPVYYVILNISYNLKYKGALRHGIQQFNNQVEFMRMIF